MIPTIHLDECPEPAAYWPNEWVVVLYTAVRERIAPIPGGAWELGPGCLRARVRLPALPF